MPKDFRQATIYDPCIQHWFENWIIDSNIKIKYNVATYFIETKKKGWFFSFLKRIGFNVNDEYNILRAVTNQPRQLAGKNNVLLNRYKEIILNGSIQDIDDITITEIKDPERIMRGIRKKRIPPPPK